MDPMGGEKRWEKKNPHCLGIFPTGPMGLELNIIKFPRFDG